MSDDSQDNPYQAPVSKAVAEERHARKRYPHFLVILLVVSLAVVAAGATFFTTCLGAFALDISAGFALWPIYAIAAFVAFVATARLGLKIANAMADAEHYRISSFSLVGGGIVAVLVFFMVHAMPIAGPIFSFFVSTSTASLLISVLQRAEPRE